MLERVYRAGRVLGVVGADRYRVELRLVFEQLVARQIAARLRISPRVHEIGRLSRDKIRRRDDLNVGHFFVFLHMRSGYPAGADDRYLEFFRGINDDLGLIFLEGVKTRHFFCHM